MTKQKSTLLSWSTGKDCAWALHLLRQQPDIAVTGLVTTINSSTERVAMHGTHLSVARTQAFAAGLPLFEIDLPYPCDNATYDRLMGAFLAQAKADGTDAIAFGDLFLEDIRRYREERTAASGLEALFPLWGADTATLARDMIDAGLDAYLVCVDPKVLPPKFAGRRFNASLLASLPAGVDPCGENGEFHTLACDGPMFRHAMPLARGEITERDGFVYCDFQAIQEHH